MIVDSVKLKAFGNFSKICVKGLELKQISL